jgi:ABC-type amino acid transport substrate-binding protein
MQPLHLLLLPLVFAAALPSKPLTAQVALTTALRWAALNGSEAEESGRAVAVGCATDLAPSGRWEGVAAALGRAGRNNADFGGPLPDHRLSVVLSTVQNYSVAQEVRAIVPHVRRGGWTAAHVSGGNSGTEEVYSAVRSAVGLPAVLFRASAASEGAVRVVPGAASQARAVAAVVRFFGWSRLAVLHAAATWGREFATGLSSASAGGIAVWAVELLSSANATRSALMQILTRDLSVVVLHGRGEDVRVVWEAEQMLVAEGLCARRCFVWVLTPATIARQEEDDRAEEAPDVSLVGGSLQVRFPPVDQNSADELEALVNRGLDALGVVCGRDGFVWTPSSAPLAPYAADAMSLAIHAVDAVLSERNSSQALDAALCSSSGAQCELNRTEQAAGRGPASCHCAGMDDGVDFSSLTDVTASSASCGGARSGAALGSTCGTEWDVVDEAWESERRGFFDAVLAQMRRADFAGISGRVVFNAMAERVSPFALYHTLGRTWQDAQPVGAVATTDAVTFDVEVTQTIDFGGGQRFSPSAPDADPTSPLQAPRDYATALRPLRCLVAPTDTAWQFWDADSGDFDGIAVRIFRTAAEALRLNYTLTRLADPTYEAIISAVERGEADLGVGVFSITTERAARVDFSRPFATTSLVVLAPTGAAAPMNIFAFAEPFKPSLWVAIAIATLLMAAVLYVLETPWVAPFCLGSALHVLHACDALVCRCRRPPARPALPPPRVVVLGPLSGAARRSIASHRKDSVSTTATPTAPTTPAAPADAAGAAGMDAQADERTGQSEKSGTEGPPYRVWGLVVPELVLEGAQVVYEMLWTFFGPEEKYTHVSSRIMILLWLFTVFVITNSFTASLTSFLTVQRAQGSIRGPEDLRSGMRVATLAASAEYAYVVDSDAGLGIQRRDVLSLTSYEAIIEAVQSGRAAAAVSTRALLEEALAKLQPGCGVSIVGPDFGKAPWAFPVRRDAFFAADMDRVIAKLSASGGYIAATVAAFLPSGAGCLAAQDEALGSDDRLGAESFYGLFMVLGAVAALAMVSRCLDVAFSGDAARARRAIQRHGSRGALRRMRADEPEDAAEGDGGGKGDGEERRTTPPQAMALPSRRSAATAADSVVELVDVAGRGGSRPSGTHVNPLIGKIGLS